tara:strand:- start:1421 stop:2230 length:810 start_codon:yes stop_codon:yes gene_type:complete
MLVGLALGLGLGLGLRKEYKHKYYSKVIERGNKVNNKLNDKEFYFYIRGHIRNSFETDRLKNFVNNLKIHFPNIKFVLQTWKEQECKKGNSWKNIKENDTIITIDKIKEYFEDDDMVKNCIIVDENDIKLIGNLDGNVTKKTRASIKGWKNMWYGINKGLEQINDDNMDKLVVNFRYDYFDIPQTVYNENQVINFLYKYLDNNKTSFMQIDGSPGIDNLYIGTVKNMKILVEKFNTNLDNIVKSKFNKDVKYQEQIVYNVADMIESIVI